MVVAEQKIKRNASASAFGWEFQANAAIVLFIRNIEDADSVRVEGAREDIEIYLSNGQTIYSQAKAQMENDPGKNSTTRFNEALRTLADNSMKDDCEQLIYVTNDDYPLGKSLDLSTFHGGGYLGFDELTPEMQAYVSEKAAALGMTDTDLSKLSIMVISFRGKDPETRHKAIRTRVQDLLGKLDLNRRGTINDGLLRDQWGLLFQENAGNSDTSICLSKEDFVWPIIVMLCKVGEGDSCFADYDDDLVQDILSEYSSTINYQSQKFEFVTKLAAAFESFASLNGTGRLDATRRSFIDAHWKDYIEELGLDAVADNEVQELVARLILQKVLYRQRIIEVVKEGVNLAD